MLHARRQSDPQRRHQRFCTICAILRGALLRAKRSNPRSRKVLAVKMRADACARVFVGGLGGDLRPEAIGCRRQEKIARFAGMPTSGVGMAPGVPWSWQLIRCSAWREGIPAGSGCEIGISHQRNRIARFANMPTLGVGMVSGLWWARPTLQLATRDSSLATRHSPLVTPAQALAPSRRRYPPGFPRRGSPPPSARRSCCRPCPGRRR